MSDLVAFLRARLDEDEAAAKAAASEHLEAWSPVRTLAHQQARVVDVDGMPVAGTELYSVAAHVARHDPARVLREVAAKRDIIICCSVAQEPNAFGRPNIRAGMARRILGAMAMPYADHPDYDPAWRP